MNNYNFSNPQTSRDRFVTLFFLLSYSEGVKVGTIDQSTMGMDFYLFSGIRAAANTVILNNPGNGKLNIAEVEVFGK